MPTGMASEHFSWAELTHSDTAISAGLDNTPTPEAEANLQRLVGVLEKVRTLLGDKPMVISSGYRSPAVNIACSGATNSAHVQGLAADWVCPDFGTPLEICCHLEPHVAELGIDQLIYDWTWCHLGLSADTQEARNQCLTINENGTNTGFA